MMETVCYPAMEGSGQELRLRGAAVELKSLPPKQNLATSIWHMGDEQNFIYKIWPQGFTYRARSGNPLLPAGDLPAGGQSG
jgi:choline/glycine/proline betaine transport protein